MVRHRINRMSKADKVYQTIIYSVVGLLILISIFPLVYIIGLSFTSELEWNQSHGMVIIPTRPSVEAYRSILSGTFVWNSLKISVMRTVVGTFLTIFFSMCVGYVLSRKDLPFKRVLLFMVLITILFTGGLIPTFLVLTATKIYNTFWAFIVPGLVSSWSVLVFKQFFLNIPDDIEESARIDGASEIRLMWVIVVPLSKAVIAALSLFTAVGHWNAWFDAAVFINNPNLEPLMLMLRNLFVNASIGYTLQGQDIFNTESRMTPISFRMAITVIGTIPILCVYPFLQKHFTKGMYVGAVKG